MVKKLKKIFRYWLISIPVLAVWTIFCRILFRIIWNFDILDKNAYLLMADFWDKGGVFDTWKDYSLGLSLFLFPIIWLILTYKLYKYGVVKFLTNPIIKTYRYFTRPETLDIEHVVIKNLGSKEKSLDEMISDKVKEQNKSSGGHTSKDIRKMIAAKIEENENQ